MLYTNAIIILDMHKKTTRGQHNSWGMLIQNIWTLSYDLCENWQGRTAFLINRDIVEIFWSLLWQNWYQIFTLKQFDHRDDVCEHSGNVHFILHLQEKNWICHIDVWQQAGPNIHYTLLSWYETIYHLNMIVSHQCCLFLVLNAHKS